MSDELKFFRRLVEGGHVTESQCRELRARHGEDLLGLLVTLVRQDPRQREALGKLWGDHLGVAYVDPEKTFVQYELAGKLPEKFARERRVAPLYELHGALTVATPTPRDRDLIAALENHLDVFVSPLFAFPDQVEALLDVTYQSESVLTQMIAHLHAPHQSADTVVSMDAFRKLSEDRAIIDFCRGLMLYAVKLHASDIHLEPGEQGVRIRMRVDGVLQTIFQIDRALYPAVVTRFKLLAGANISESRLPQDGRLTLPLSYRTLDIRFSCVPTLFGEKLVLRLLGQSQFASVPDLTELDTSRSILAGLRRIATLPYGVCLITGPTGSGKTTTLYALLKHLNQPGLNIMTIENPVEYRLPGINQVQVHEEIGLTFAQTLRAFLRQDPNVILVGEIRDRETADIACQAALTGHLVLSTLHTGSAVQALTRLADIGMDMALVAPAMAGLMAQRLVRRLCSHCRERYLLSPEQVRELFDVEGDAIPDIACFRAKGCDHCHRLGYQGRLALHELWIINEEARRLIARNAGASELQACARAAGYMPLRHDGIKKVLRGLTTFEEIARVVWED